MRRRREAVRLIAHPVVRSTAVSGSLALQAPPAGRSRGRRGGAVLRVVGAEDEGADPDLRTAHEVIVRLVVEVLAGVRPWYQLTRRASPEVCDALLPRLARPAAGTRVTPVRVLASWIQEPAPAVAETGAVVTLAGRVQALAMRLEPHRARWRCTALETTLPPGPP